MKLNRFVSRTVGSTGNMGGHPSNTMEPVLSILCHPSRPASSTSFMQDPGGEHTGSFSCTSLAQEGMASNIINLVVDGPWALLKDLSYFEVLCVLV